jgi:N-carbamoylputrescine amidase
MPELTIAAAAAPFTRDMDACLATISDIISDARKQGVGLLVIPEAALGGYVETLHGSASPPPALHADGPELAAVAEMAGDMVLTIGFCEDGGDGIRYNAAACISGGEVIGVHRKTHLPLDEHRSTTVGDSLATYDTSVGRIAMIICYEKAFPEVSRTVTLDGAQVICIMSAWPTSATNAAPELIDDRQWRRAELWDRARAAENSLVVASANQTGSFGKLDFLGGARICGPGGDIIDATGPEPGLAIATLDLEATLEKARRALSPIRDLRPEVYAVPAPVPYDTPVGA